MPLENRVDVGRQSITADEDFSVPEHHNSLGMRVDLACGQQKRPLFVGVDRVGSLADIEHDLDVYPWPFPDNSVYEFNCAHYIEHIGFERGKDLNAFFEEVYRCLVPSGTIEVRCPYFTSPRAFQDPTHRRYICREMFNYFSRPWQIAAKVDHYAARCDFEVLTTQLLVSDEWHSRAEEAKQWAVGHYVNVVDEIIVLMRAHKPMREPAK